MSAGLKYQVPAARKLKDKWKRIQPSQNDFAIYQHPHKHPLTSSSTIKDAIICTTISRPRYLTRGKKEQDIPLLTRYPYILEELSRLASEEVKQLLNMDVTQELRQKLAHTIESLGSSPGFTWKWHDEFQPDDIDAGQSGEEEKGHAAEKGEEETDKLLADIMGLDMIKEIISTTPSVGPQVKAILQAATRVINFCSLTNIS
jgi:hypothetical protein